VLKVGLTDEGELAQHIANHFDETVVITSPQKVLEEKPDIVVHTFELPYPDANKNNGTAWNINTWYAINVGRAANKIKAVNVYLSSFMIFDGKKRFYSETSTPNPLNYYGLTKLAGETGIMSLGNYLIVRLGLLYSMQYRGLLYPYVRAMIKKRRVKCNTNFFVSPIKVSEAGEIISLLIKRGIKGVVNVGSKRKNMVDVCTELGDMFEADVIPFEGKYYDFSLDVWLLNGLGLSVRG